jgi:hypothetical protein
MRRYLVIVATLIVIGVNAAATLLPINGLATGELSALYPTGFTPAGWVFSIWSLIYVGLVAYGVHAVLEGGAAPGAGTPALARLRAIEWPYLASAAANVAWIFLWHYRFVGASVLAMLVLLGSLLVVYRRLRRRPPASALQRVIVDGTFSLYLGWITTATFANLGAWFFAIGDWPLGFTMDQWAMVTVVLATSLYVAAGIWTADAVYTAVFVWAALGIVYRASGITDAVQLAAGAGAAAVAAVTVLSLARSIGGRRRRARAA